MKHINIDQITSILVREAVLNESYQYRKPINWRLYKVEERWKYYHWIFYKSDIPSKYRIIDNQIYYKPEVTITLSCGNKENILFNTYENAKKYALELVSKMDKPFKIEYK